MDPHEGVSFKNRPASTSVAFAEFPTDAERDKYIFPKAVLPSPWTGRAILGEQTLCMSTTNFIEDRFKPVRSVGTSHETQAGVYISQNWGFWRNSTAVFIADSAQHFKSTAANRFEIGHVAFDFVAEDPHIRTVAGEVRATFVLGIHEANPELTVLEHLVRLTQTIAVVDKHLCSRLVILVKVAAPKMAEDQGPLGSMSNKRA